MINAMSGGEGLGGAASAYFAQQSRGVNGTSALNSLTGGEGGGGVAQSPATISGPGQLLSNLQQLQTQDPTKFQQAVSQIAGQLQTAAQQTQGPQSDFLTKLAAKFQSVANGGSLSQLQPGQGQHHHHHHAQQADSQGAQSQAQGIAALLQSSSSQSTSSLTLPQLFTNISAQQAYSQNSQSQSQGIAGLAQPSGSQSSSGSTLQQLFTTISTEVSQALGA